MNIDLRQGDCLEVMKTMPDGCVDLTVTSPPYDNLRTYNGNISQWSFDKFKDIADELFRITKLGGGVVVWIVNDATINGSETGTSFRQALYFMECGFKLHDTMIYNKGSCAYPDTTRYYNVFEYMFVFVKGKIKTFNPIQDKKNVNGGQKVSGSGRQPDGSTKKHSALVHNTGRCIKEYGLRFNIWDIRAGKGHTTKDSYAYEHPAMFPEQLANDHIISWSNENDVVFDPFLGSGTTGKMAILNNRNFIGIELDEEYFKIAQRRIDEAIEKKEGDDYTT